MECWNPRRMGPEDSVTRASPEIIQLRHRRTRRSYGSAAAAELMAQSVFFFGNGEAEGTRSMKGVLGGKGANLAEMTNLGVPVPQGFTIAASECISYLRDGKYSD